MSSYHRIRLRGPWECKLAEGIKRVRFPTTWREAFGENAENVRASRAFGSPDGLETDDVVWLELQLGIGARIELNGQWIGDLAAGTVRFDVTERLDERNQIRLEFERPTPEELSVTITEAALLIEG